MNFSCRLRALLPAVAPALLPGCFLEGDRDAPPPPAAPLRATCSESHPQIFSLDMAPSAKVGASGDYEVPGEIRVSCSAVAVQVHVNTGGNGSEVRWKVSAGDGGAMPLTLRLATHSSGERVTYDVTAVDASERSSETLYEAVLLE